MITTHLAADDLVSLSHQVYYISAAVGGTFALVIGIWIGLKNSVSRGIGAGIAAFCGGLLFSILIMNAVGFRDMGNSEVQQRTGVHNSSPYGQ